MNDQQRFLIRDLPTSPKAFWCVHLPGMPMHDLGKHEVVLHLRTCVEGRGQTIAIAKMAEQHRGLWALFKGETCPEWLMKETGMSLQQAHETLANIETFGIRVYHKINAIATNPRWMLGYAAARFRKPNVLVYGTHGMDPMGRRTAHEYMDVAAENCCVIHMTPTSGPQCPPAATCITLGCD